MNHGTSFQSGSNLVAKQAILRPRQGIVHPILEDGYPRLNYYEVASPTELPTLGPEDPNYSPEMFKGFSTYTDAQKKESLAYLFDPGIKHAGKKSFANVSGLFQQDENGFYYYNSTGKAHEGYIDSTTPYDGRANYAWFDEDANRFVLYKEYGVDSSEALGQFFPFDGPEHVFTIDEDGELAHKQADSFRNIGAAETSIATPGTVTGIKINQFSDGSEHTFNHYFGIYLEIPFIQGVGGMTYYDGAERETTFHFSGDDDLWLFVDNVLVGDVGGIHGISTLDINFATGVVEVNANTGGTEVPGTQTTSLKEIYDAANKVDPTVELVPGNSEAVTYADGSYHTIRVFYMERGNSASNLGIKFNVPTMPLSEIEKTNEDGEPLPGAEFSLYQAVKGADGNYIEDPNQPTPLRLGSTDSEGKLTLLNEDGHPLLISNLTGEHFILREKTVPEGYRSPGDMHLVKHRLGDGSVVLISDPESPTGSKWNTGSYASAVETASVKSGTVYLRNDGPAYDANTSLAVVQNGELVGLEGTPGTMFAIVLKWTNGRPSPSSNLSDHYNGTPVYGSPETGYKLAKLEMTEGMNDDEKTQAYNEAVLEALLGSPYLFKKGDDGFFAVTVDNMPGDITQYLHAGANENLENLHYTIMYGWTDLTEDEITSGKDAVTGADIKAAEHQFYRLYSRDFSRTFAVTFNVVNINDELSVRKEDDEGNPLSGATFSLYKEEDVEFNADGTYSFPSGASPVDTETTGTDGTLVFHGIPADEYYLVEDVVPNGYDDASRPAPVPVIVDDTGVYAHAGTAQDNVRVERSVGRLVKTMHEFAMDNDIDETLHNIIYTPQKSGDKVGDDWNWSVAGDVVHLKHTGEAHDSNEGFVSNSTGAPVKYTAEAGWSRLLIQQCNDAAHRHSTIAYKENLGTRDLTHLFTREVTVVVKNRRIPTQAEIEGTKTLQPVDGYTGEIRTLKENEFTFKLEAVTQGAPMPNPAQVKNDATGAFTFPEISFNKAGEYKYKLTEVKGRDQTITYDEGYWEVTITVATNSSNELTASESYAKFNKDGTPTAEQGLQGSQFINRYSALDPVIPTPPPDPYDPVWPWPTPTPLPTPGPTPAHGGAPQTGDTSNIGVWIALIIGGACGLAACAALWLWRSGKYRR